MPRLATVAVVLLAIALSGATARRDRIEIVANENTHPAGILANGVLTVALETHIGSWQPDGPGGNRIDSIAAFAEVGQPPSTPGPLIRVPVGTIVRGTLHNTLARPLIIHGLGRTRGQSDSSIVLPGQTMAFEFRATQSGTYFYNGHSPFNPNDGRDPFDMQLGGAVVVDGVRPSPDRVMVISWYFLIDPRSPTGIDRGVMAINGRSWPHTERLSYAQGDSVRWRVINLTESDHPMHLHGFFFRVNSRNGDGVDTTYAPAQQRMAVTEMVNPFSAVELSWRATTPGNWVFHCHYATHVSNFVTLDTKNGVFDSTLMAHHAEGPHQMFGLVMGITVTPNGSVAVAGAPTRRIRIEQREHDNVYGVQPGLSYVMSDNHPVDATAMPVPGPSLILERGKRVEVTIVNESRQHAAVHWHGIELESYPDGVPGWSGSGTQTYPAIPPHDSLTVRWTPPRAGSFMYHSHFNEAGQMGGGLYGPIIVLEPGQHYDPDRDRVLFFGSAGPVMSILTAPPATLLNGSAQPAPMEMQAGHHYRLRFFNLAGDAPTVVTLTQGSAPLEWRALAKDGYPLPPSQALAMPAELTFDPGEIYDFDFVPAHAGEFTLSFGLPQPPPPPPAKPGDPPAAPSSVPPLVRVAVHVR